jgi:hypothetical protein
MIGDAWLRSPAAPFLGACVVLAGILAIEWMPASSEPAAVAPPRPAHAQTIVAKTDDSRDTDDWSDTVLERPLFTVGRKPPKPPALGRQASGAGLPRLSGIMITPFGRRAIFMPEGAKVLVLSEGATVGDHTISRIATDRVYLSGDTVLTPTLDKQHTGGPASGTSPFVPNEGPGFPRPPFQPGIAGQVMTTPPDDNAQDGDNGPPNRPPMRPPFLRPGLGPMRPQGRE